MGFYDDVILPRCIDKLLSTRPILNARERIVQGLSGDVMELGFGSARISTMVARHASETGGPRP